MAFWGPNQTQRNAQGRIGELPNWLYEAMRSGFAKEAEAWLKANGYTDEYIANLRQQIQQGFGTPQDIRATGQEIMPGINDLITRRNTRLDEQGNRIAQQGERYNAIPGVDETISNRDQLQFDKGAGIGRNEDFLGGLIDTGFGSQRRRTADTADTIAKDTGNTYSGLRSDSDTAFGDVRSAADRGFGYITNRAADTFSGVRDRINQGRDFALGTTARAFAPAMAATLRRIRAAGIDPNSPEAASLLQRVDTARGHAFDDSMRGTLDQLNQTDLAESANRQGLDLSRLSNDQVLALQNAANKQGLSLDEYLKRSNNTREARNILNELDQGKMAADVQNADTSFQRGQDWATEKQNQELISRGLRIDDVNNRNAIGDKENAFLDKRNQSELTDQELLNQQFQAGANLTGANNQRRDQANTQLGQAGTQQYDVSAQQGNAASGNAAQAGQQYQHSWNLEAPNAGWGSKLIGGLAGPALSLIPGVGPIASSIVGTAAAGAIPGATGNTPQAQPQYNPWGSGNRSTPSWADIFKRNKPGSSSGWGTGTGDYAGWGGGI